MLRRSVFALSCLIPVYAAASLLLSGCGPGVIGSTVGSSSSTPPQTPSAVNLGPKLGYIWSDKSQTMRPVLGVPGSSQLGQSVVTARLYVHGAASATSALALLEETDGTLDLMALPTGQPARLSVTLPGAEFRFAPAGQTAIAFVPGSGAVTVLSDLTGTPRTATMTFAGAIAEAAVSDNGTVAAALGPVSAGASVQVRTISIAGNANVAGSAASLGGIAFATGDDLLIADATANTLTLVRSSATSPAPQVTPSAGMLNAPQGVGASSDGRWAVLTNAGDANIVRIDLTGQSAPQSFACACKPSLVAPLAGSGVFRVTAADSGPAWMIDAAATSPRVLFIPARNADGTPVKAIHFAAAAPAEGVKQ